MDKVSVHHRKSSNTIFASSHGGHSSLDETEPDHASGDYGMQLLHPVQISSWLFGFANTVNSTAIITDLYELGEWVQMCLGMLFALAEFKMANDPGVQIVEHFGFDYHAWLVKMSLYRETFGKSIRIVPSYLSDPPSKRRHDRETQQAVKIRRREEAEAELMARQDLREHFAEPELPPVYQIAAAAYREDSAMTYRLSQW
ncbi:uncharacterized protein F5891DRAFT_978522 [Suillus fuscotomentosus]|uniref:Uncharacterized protein n=1 Tax=Suillus fuscotomentosus TaxID=1912939 RepID=A0AAD4EAK2_9AGAM|nr:uncharacterized protein F5891DRAFT_978522 [Suillus fuscotomentosus]KAG1902617.1 hypothetical protein F5891DRAFT_978522 [Suillus fuscotomentosus]